MDTNKEQTYWENVRVEASISILNSLLETTDHSVIEEPVINKLYAETAVAYADTLIKELRKDKNWFAKILEV